MGIKKCLKTLRNVNTSGVMAPKIIDISPVGIKKMRKTLVC